MLLFLVSACSTGQKQQQVSSRDKMNYLMLADLALKRQNTEQAYNYFDKLLGSSLTARDYQHIEQRLNSEIHQPFRFKVLKQWHISFPDDVRALETLAKLSLCQQGMTDSKYLEQWLKVTDDPIDPTSLLSCLNAEQQFKLLEDLGNKFPQQSQILLTQCQRLIDRSQPEEASRCLSRISEQDMSPGLLKAMADMYMAINHLKPAERLFKHLLSLDSKHKEGRYALADLLYRQDRHVEALAQLTILNSQQPGNRNVEYLLAATHYALANYQQSTEWFEKLLINKGFRDTSLYYLGMISIQKGNKEQAIKYLSAVNQSDFYLAAQLNLWRLVSEQNINVAMDGLYQLIESNHRDRMTIKLAQIDILDKAGEAQRATQEVVSLADDYPQHLGVQVLRMNWLIDRDYLTHLEANLTASLESMDDSNNQRRLVESVIYYLLDQQLGTNALSLLTVQTVIEADTEDYQFLEALGHAMAGNYSQAIRILKGLTGWVNRPEWKNALAYTHVLSGKHLDTAERLLTEVLEIDPESSAYLDSMGWLRFKQGRFKEAIELLEKADKLDSAAAIKAHLIEAYLAIGEQQLARELLQQAMDLFPYNKVLLNLNQQFPH